MATNDLFQEHVTCPVCLDIYDNPHSLECRHIICLQCLNRLKDRGRVQCPECREEMPFKRIKPDFKTKKLAESYKKEKEAESKNGIPDRQPKVCEVCKLTGKAVVSRCKTCDTYLCQSCELAHKGVRATKNHVIESEAEVISALQDKAKTNLEKSKEDLKKVEKNLSDISASIAFVNTKKANQLAKLNVRIDRLIRQLENRRAKLKHELNKGNDSTFENLSQNKQVFENHKTLLQESIGSLTHLSRSNDLKTLMEPAVTCNLSEQSKKIKDDIRQLECKIQDSPVKVVNGPDFNVKTYVTVRNKNISYADLMKVECVQEEHFKLPDEEENLLKMCMINDELWCCGGDSIRIFDRDCALERELALDQILSTRGLTKGPNDDVFLASAEGCGLQQLNCKEKEHVCEVLEGSFSDVCYYNHCLYALDCEENKVYVLEKGDSQWDKKMEWDFENGPTVDDETKICVNRYGVFISIGFQNRIYQYSHNGVLQQTAGRSSEEEGNENVAGIVNYPIICGVDSDGIVLIADYENDIFKLYNCNNRTWQVIENLEKMKQPICAVLDGNDLFISISSHLLKYKLV